MIIAVLASCGAQKEAEPQLAANGMIIAPYLTDLAQAKAQAAESGKKILVDFWADW
jgi:thiol:disulfide interchange protein